MTYAFAGQIFQFVARPGNVDKFGPRAKKYWAEFVSGRSISWAKMCLGPKYAWGQS